MTVRRSAQQIYPLDQAVVAEYASQVLKADSRYRDVLEYRDDKQSRFVTRVQPGFPLVLGTLMTIALEQRDHSTVVDVTTQSQLLITGDIFGLYDEYIRRFFSRLERSVGASGISEKLVITDASDGGGP